MDSLAALFPEGDHRFHLTLKRGEARDFFLGHGPDETQLAERRHWLTSEPERYAALLAEGEPLLGEFAGWCRAWGVKSASTVHELGGRLEPDFLLLSPDADGRFRLRGGALCFPTGWALTEKLGLPIDAIHGVVPGLNSALGAAIDSFLAKLRPGAAFLRDNWGIAASSELNLHPSRGLAAPEAGTPLDRLWLRVEHQALAALPDSRGVLFGIRIALHRLDSVAAHRDVARRLGRSLATMPNELATYKRLEAIRSELITRLEQPPV